MVLVTRWDRFARNLTQALVQIEKFREHGVEVNSIEQYIDYNQPDYIVMEDIQYQNGVITFKVLAMLLGLVQTCCAEKDIPFEVVSPNV